MPIRIVSVNIPAKLWNRMCVAGAAREQTARQYMIAALEAAVHQPAQNPAAQAVAEHNALLEPVPTSPRRRIRNPASKRGV